MFVGGVNQLPSPRPGDAMNNIMKFLETRGLVCNFVNNFRSGDAAPILNENYDAIEKRQPARIKFDGVNCIHVDTSDLRYNPPKGCWNQYENEMMKRRAKEQIPKRVVDMIKKLGLKEYDHQVITRTNEYRIALVHAIDSHFHEQDKYAKASGPYDNKGYETGRKIAFTKNDYFKKILTNRLMFIGDIYDYNPKDKSKKKIRRIKTIDRLEKGHKRMITFVTLDGKTTIELELDKWVKGHLKKASASTVSSIQGIGLPDIIHALPYWCSYSTISEIVVAWTRFTNRFIYVGTREDLYKAIMTNDPPRRSKLFDFLVDACHVSKISLENKFISSVPTIVKDPPSASTTLQPPQQASIPIVQEVDPFEDIMTHAKTKTSMAEEIAQAAMANQKKKKPMAIKLEDDEQDEGGEEEQPPPKAKKSVAPKENGKAKKVQEDDHQDEEQESIRHKEGLVIVTKNKILQDYCKALVESQVLAYHMISTTWKEHVLKQVEQLGGDAALATSLIATCDKLVGGKTVELTALDHQKKQTLYSETLRTYNEEMEKKWDASHKRENGTSEKKRKKQEPVEEDEEEDAPPPKTKKQKGESEEEQDQVPKKKVIKKQKEEEEEPKQKRPVPKKKITLDVD